MNATHVRQRLADGITGAFVALGVGRLLDGHMPPGPGNAYLIAASIIVGFVILVAVNLLRGAPTVTVRVADDGPEPADRRTWTTGRQAPQAPPFSSPPRRPRQDPDL